MVEREAGVALKGGKTGRLVVRRERRRCCRW
jgi:hypothetical protein